MIQRTPLAVPQGNSPISEPMPIKMTPIFPSPVNRSASICGYWIKFLRGAFSLRKR